MEGSILESIGVEIIDVMSPVSICMLLVVLFVYALSPSSPSPYSSPIRTAANLVYLETPSDSAAEKLEGSLLNALVFVVLIAVVTFILVALYYYNFTNCLIYYMRFSTFFVLATMGGGIFLSIIQHFSIPIDSITCFLLLFNFTVVGVLSVFSGGIPIVLRQGYMVSLGIIVAAWFTKLPEWTTWTLLVALALYDLVAVLAPGGPLKLLVDMASSRDEDLPALVYEARPTASSRPRGSALDLLVAGVSDSASIELQAVSRGNADQNEIALGNRGNPEYNAVEVGHVRARRVTALDLLFGGVSDSVSTELQSVSRGNDDQNEIALGNRGNPEYTAVEVGHIRAEERGSERDEDERSPLMISSRERESSSSESSQYSTMNVLPNRTRQYGSRESEIVVNEEMSPLVELMGREQMQRESSLPEITPGIKLGLGDFVFYSVLVGRAAMYDLMTVYACYLAIISGLGCTLILLSVCHRALPALPISIALGTMFYFLTRLLMEPFVVGTATNLMMF